jgi:hypothetical protein
MPVTMSLTWITGATIRGNPVGSQPSKIGRIPAFSGTGNAVFVTLTRQRMITFEVWRCNHGQGGMRSPFPPYRLTNPAPARPA